MFYGELQTRNFTFRSFADTEEQVREQLKVSWAKHRILSGATDTWGDWEDAVCVFCFSNGDTWRDGDLFLSYNTPNPYGIEEEECPNHEGGFDCNVFCDLCEGEQYLPKGEK